MMTVMCNVWQGAGALYGGRLCCPGWPALRRSKHPPWLCVRDARPHGQGVLVGAAQRPQLSRAMG